MGKAPAETLLRFWRKLKNVHRHSKSTIPAASWYSSPLLNSNSFFFGNETSYILCPATKEYNSHFSKTYTFIIQKISLIKLIVQYIFLVNLVRDIHELDQN